MVVDRNHRHPDGPGLGIGEQGGPARGPGPVSTVPTSEVTLSSRESSGPGGANDHTARRHVVTGVGLLIDGAVVSGAAGTYPVTNPARPAEVVLDAPAATPAQLDLAVAAPAAPHRAWAALTSDERAAGSWPPPRRAWRRSRRVIWPAC